MGKSTLINTLTGRRAAKTGDEAGITRTEQRIVLEDDFYLWDTPGVLWPRILMEESGYRLAASGAMGRNAYDEQEVAFELLVRLMQAYPQLLQARYGLEPGLSEEQGLEAIARKRRAMLAGARPNLQKAAEILIHEFRAGSMGRITLETAAEYAQWLAQGKMLEAERLLRKEQAVAAGHVRAPRRSASPTGSR